MRAAPSRSPQVVHLELHTSDREASSRFYSGLLQWQTERIDTAWGSYQALRLGSGLDGGIVECGTRRASWLPYVAVDQIAASTELARRLGHGCCSPRGKARPAGGPSCPRPRAERSRSGNPSQRRRR